MSSLQSFAMNTKHKSGRKSDIFQPPTTPTISSTTNLSCSTMSVCEDSDYSFATGGRKRSRDDCFTQSSSRFGWGMTGSDESDYLTRSGSFDVVTPAPLANTRYRLAGGLDTPGVLAAKAVEAQDSVYYDNSFRRDLGGGRREDEAGVEVEEEAMHNSFPQIDTPTCSAENGSASTTQREGWKFTFETIGGVVGKVIEFCKNAPFRGFNAGGGTAYNQEAEPVASSNVRHNDYTLQKGDHCLTSIPGQYPTDDDVPDYVSHLVDDQQDSSRPAKRRQTSHTSGSELENNWIMVRDQGSPSRSNKLRQLSPIRPQSRFSIAANTSRRLTGIPDSKANSSRRSLNSRTSTATLSYNTSPAPRSPVGASYASPRTTPMNRASRIPRVASPCGSPSRSHRASMAGSKLNSPASIEAAKYAARQRAEEREADESISRFNKQLKDMIRQGKEALGSKIEISDDGFDEDDCL